MLEQAILPQLSVAVNCETLMPSLKVERVSPDELDWEQALYYEPLDDLSGLATFLVLRDWFGPPDPGENESSQWEYYLRTPRLHLNVIEHSTGKVTIGVLYRDEDISDSTARAELAGFMEVVGERLARKF